MKNTNEFENNPLKWSSGYSGSHENYTKRVSLIIPAYNSERFLGQALESVAQQTVPKEKLEVIVVNDGSTDRTSEVAKKSLEEFPFEYRLLDRKQNWGVAISRNEAINNSRGEYIMLLDADDMLLPESVRLMLDFMQDMKLEYGYSSHIRIDENGEQIGKRESTPYSRENILNFNCVGAITCFTRRTHDRIGGYDPSIQCEDYDHALKASEFLSPEQISNLKEFLYIYRIHGKNRSLVEMEESRRTACLAIENSIRRLEGEDVRIKFISKRNGIGHSYFERENETSSHT